MEIKRSGSQHSDRAPQEHFTGTVRIVPLSRRPTLRARFGVSVTFEPRRSNGMAQPPRSGRP
jgi:hypothetical protein